MAMLDLKTQVNGVFAQSRHNDAGAAVTALVFVMSEMRAQTVLLGKMAKSLDDIARRLDEPLR
jgi:hypothetical protein